MKRMIQLSLVFLIALTVCSTPSIATNIQGVDTTFTYQGQLKLDGVLVTGQYDFKFTAYDGPDPFSDTFLDDDVVLNVAVEDGIFTVQITFMSSIFNGQPLWLQTEVRETGSTTLYSLSPLQQLTPVPYATFAINADKLDNLDSTDFLTEEVDPTLPAAVQSGCEICMGWADNNDPDPDVQRCHSLSSTSINNNNYIQFDGDVDENDRLWLWIQCI